MAATRDIAATAVELLLDRSWTGSGEVPVLGPEDLSPHDMARTTTEVLGRPVRYQQQSYDDLAATLSGYGMGRAFVAGMVEMAQAKDLHGLDEGVPRTPGTLHPASPTTFRTWGEQVLKAAVQG